MLQGRETLACDDFVAIYKGSWMGRLACALAEEVLGSLTLCAALPDGVSGDGNEKHVTRIAPCSLPSPLCARHPEEPTFAVTQPMTSGRSSVY